MKKLLFLISTLLTISSLFGQGKYGEIIPDDFDQKTFFVKKNIDSLELPKNIDLSKKLPPASNQNPRGTCWAFASTYSLISYMGNINKTDNYFYLNTGKPNYKKIKSPELPIQLYFGTNDCDTGATSKDLLLKTLKEYGSISLAELKYSAKCNQTIAPDIKNKAKLDRMTDYDVEVIKSTDLNTMKKVLSEGQPLLLSIAVDDNFSKIGYNIKDNYKPLWDQYGYKDGGHAMTIVGYDDSIQAVKVLNSWGTEWGNNGYLWISYKILHNNARYYCYPVYRPKIEPYLNTFTLESTNAFTSFDKKELNSWFKSGYYRKFNDLKIELVFLDTKKTDKEYGLVEIKDENDSLLSSFYIQNNSSKEFYINDVKYSFTFNNVGRIGYNFTKKAMFFTIKQF